MDTTRRGSGTLLTLGSVVGWVVMAVALWVLLLRGGEDVVADQFGDGEPMTLATIGLLTVLVLVGLLGSLFCAERLSRSTPGALVTAGGGVLLVVAVATGALVAQAAVTNAVASAADVTAATPPAQVLAIVLTMVLAVAGVVGVMLGARRYRRPSATP